MIDVLAFDIATVTGWCRGKVGGQPKTGSINFARKDSSENAIFARAYEIFSTMLGNGSKPDLIVLEAMLPPTAMTGETSRAVRDRLAGLHAILRAAAYQRECYRIDAIPVGLVRKHFLGSVRIVSADAKRATIERCRLLGWDVADDNAADAAATWHYVCARHEPKLALECSPMFNRKLRAAT